MSIIESILQLIAPHECLQCHAEGYVLCARCSGLLPSVQPTLRLPHTRIWAVTAYEGAARQLVHRLKFERASAAAADIARSMAQAIPYGRYDAIVHVPTASVRVRQRGYDQARLIARRLSRIAGIPCRPLLVRSGSQRQVGATRIQRQQQMKSAFRAVHTAEIQNSRLLLVDDVLTTGSTIQAAADTLRAADASAVDAAVFAVAAGGFQYVPANAIITSVTEG